MDYEKLAELLFPQIDKTPEDYYAMYPQRELPEGSHGDQNGAEPDRIHPSGKSLRRVCGRASGPSERRKILPAH